MIYKTLLKLVNIIASTEFPDIISIEAKIIFPALLENIDEEYFQDQIDTEDINWKYGLELLDSYLLMNGIEGGLEYNLDALNQNDEAMVLEVICEILAMMSVFNQENFETFFNQIPDEDKKLIDPAIQPMTIGIQKEISKLYVSYSLKERNSFNNLINELKKMQRMIEDQKEVIEILQDEKQEYDSIEEKFNQSLKKKDQDLKALNMIREELVNSMESFKDRVEELELKNEKLTDLNKNYERKLFNLEDEMSKLTNLLAEYQDEINSHKQLQKHYKNREKIYEETLNKLSVYEEKVKSYDTLVSNIQELKNFITILHARNKQLSDQIRKQMDKILELETNEKNLIKQNTQFSSEINLLENQIKELKKENLVYKNHNRLVLHQNNLQDSTVTEDIDNNLLRTNTQESNNIHLKKIESLEKENQELQNQLIAQQGRGNEEEIEDLLKKIEQMGEQMQKLNSEIEKLFSENKILKNEKEKVQEELETRFTKKFQKQINQLKQSNEEAIKKNEEVMQFKDEQIQNFSDQINKLNQMIVSQKKGARSSIRDIVIKVEPQQLNDSDIPSINDDEIERKISEKIINQSRKSLRDYQVHQKQLMNQINELEEDLDSVRKTLQLKKNKIVEMSSENKNLKEELEDKIEEIKQLKIELRRLQALLNKKEESQIELADQQNIFTQNQSQVKQVPQIQDQNFMIQQNIVKAQPQQKIVYQTDQKITEKLVPIDQDEFDYQNSQLLYSVYMSYYRNYLKIDEHIAQRNKQIALDLTEYFSIGKLLND